MIEKSLELDQKVLILLHQYYSFPKSAIVDTPLHVCLFDFSPDMSEVYLCYRATQNSTWDLPFTVDTFFMYFADEGEGNGFGEFIWLLLEKIRKSITKKGETKTIIVSTPDGVPHYEKQGCQRIKWSLCSDWVKRKLELEDYLPDHVESEGDNIMVLKNGDLRLSIQNFETLFKSFVKN